MEIMNEESTTAFEELVSLGTVIAVVQDVLKRWFLILTAALIAAMAAFVYIDYSYTPQYTTTTTFVVSSGGTSSTTYQNLAATTELAGVFTEVINSSLLRQKVMEATGITGFDGTITAGAVEGTNLLNMTVRGSNPRTVFVVTRAVIEHHGIVSDQVLGDTVLEVLQEPTVPTYPVNPLNISAAVKKAALYAAAAMMALLAFLSAVSGKIRSKSEADKKLSCRVLGELYHERKHRTLKDMLRRRKTSILISDPLTSFVYTESVHKLSGRIDKRRRRGERIIMVTSLLENEGKSTVAVNLALSWAKKGKRVLLVDCDLRKSACHRILELPKDSAGVVKILQGQATPEQCIIRVPGSTLHLLPGGKGVRSATNLVNSPQMKALLETAAAEYDLVVLDTPPMALAPDAECLSAFAHAAVMVVRQNGPGAADLNEALKVFEKSDVHMMGCVLNNVYGSAGFAPAFRYGAYGKYGKYGYGKYGYGRYGYGYGQYGYGSKRKSGKNESAGEEK